MMTFGPGLPLLRARYQLLALVAKTNASETWTGFDDDENQYLIKLWRYLGDEPDTLQRALWDAELRTLYRVGSSPGADEAMLVMRDAGVDRPAHAFVMVLEAPGYDTLAQALVTRQRFAWLSCRNPDVRRELWCRLLRIAEGLAMLHEQHVLHRDIRAETVFLNTQLGPSSLRLGGFEWSVRLGVPAGEQPPQSWSSSPSVVETDDFGYRHETDWFAFGMLAARCMLNLEKHGSQSATDRYHSVLADVTRVENDLSALERALLQRLIARSSNERLTHIHDIRNALQDIITQLDHGGPEKIDGRPLVLAIDPEDLNLLEHATTRGFQPDSTQKHAAYNPSDVLHTAGLTDFLRRDLVDATIYAVPNVEYYLLLGAHVTLKISQMEFLDVKTKTMSRTWDVAYCWGVDALKWHRAESLSRILPTGKIDVRTKRDIRKTRWIRQDAISWERYLPRVDRAEQLRASLTRFHDFIRCTNQIELLIRDAEIFRYQIISRDNISEPGLEQITVREVLRDRAPLPFFQIKGGLPEFLLRELATRKPDCNLVLLTAKEQDGLAIPELQKSDAWTVHPNDIDPSGTIRLVRPLLDAQRPSAHDIGTIRAFGMFGQVALIRRRKRAIDRLKRHSYLLRSLSAPGQVYMDTGEVQLIPPIDSAKVDPPKIAAIKDILRVRPIYALQGPPGTGKTTLVAHLLRKIIDDDPVAQVLVTAPAHGAVDVLREKVRDEAFGDVDPSEQPLAVRLGLPSTKSKLEEGTVEEVALRILRNALHRLNALANREACQDDWHKAVEDMIFALESDRTDVAASDFCELLKRGASITYCTTSAGDLEALAQGTQSFDWTIVEEAGKAHGFDLALPLQAGHRWLLIGDHKQLPPYRIEAYKMGIAKLGDAVAALRDLPDRGGNLLDQDWLRTWGALTDAEEESFKTYANDWLKTFDRVFHYCGAARGAMQLTGDAESGSNGSAAGMLSGQHRMHPTIGTLISDTFYKERKLTNQTVDHGVPLAKVLHPFTAPGEIEGRAIVWVDIPWAGSDVTCAERGRPKYTNPAEVRAIARFIASLRQSDPVVESLKLAVLSPYSQQVGRINQDLLRSLKLPPGLELKQGRRGRLSSASSEGRLAHTVDSFQGNQADVVIVSLVRNNTRDPGEGLGFLADPARLNVLLSRAVRLLVLVGSWDFFWKQVEAVALDAERHEHWHWKKVLVSLNDWFMSRHAVLLRGNWHGDQ